MAEKLISLDLPPITLTQAKEALELFISLKRPVFLHGPVGVGKSELIAGIGREQNRRVIDIRMSQMDISDLRGIPFYNSDNKQMEWAAPCVLPTDPSDKSILFLDELNCASPSIQATAYQLILDRKVGDYTLPEGVTVVAAGNREKDKGTTFKIASPLLNRFVHLDIKYDFKTWLKWAKLNAINNSVINFLTCYESDLTSFDPKVSSRAFATPRSWKYVSDCLNALEKDGVDEDINMKLLTLAVSSCIGEDLAVKFTKWYATSSKLNVEDILSGKVTTLPKSLQKNAMSFLLNLSHEMCIILEKRYKAELKKNNLNAFYSDFNNAFAFIQSNSGQGDETPLSFISLLTQNYGINLNYEKAPVAQAFINKPSTLDFMKRSALLKYEEMNGNNPF